MNRRATSPLVVATMGTLITACGADPSHGDAAEGGAGQSAGQAAEQAPLPGSRVFDPEHIAQVQIEVDAVALELLRAEAAQAFGAEFTYVSAQVTYDGEVFEDVGIRIKGNSSRLGLGGSGKPADGYPYKLDFNRFVDGQELDGQTKVNLHNNSSLNEYLSYGAFRDAGVPSSRTGWAEVTLNGADLGLYTLVEQVNERMLANYFDDPEGGLYKPEPPVGYLAYQGEDIAAYGDLGYKADAETDHAAFLNLVRALDQTDPEAWDAVIDTDSVLTYFAGNVALGNWDTYTAMGHNYYLFEDAPGHFVMLPWDLNLSQADSSGVCPSDVQQGLPGGAGMGPGGMGFGGMPPEGFELPEGFDPSQGFPEGFEPPEGGELPEGFDPSQGFPEGFDGLAMGGFGGFGASGGAPLYDSLMQSDRFFARYLEILELFLDGAGSQAALGSAIETVMPVLAERLPTEDVEALRSTIASRVTAIANNIPTTTTCSSGTSE